jgi:hypothetical protein
MKPWSIPSLFIFSVLSATSGFLAAQPNDNSDEKTRQQVKMERDDFLRTHRFDGLTETWVLKRGVEPPAGVKSRADMKAERDKFLSNNRWDDVKGAWVPIKGQPPRNVSTMSRDQVRSETRQFLRTHEWDEISESWIDKPTTTKKK